MKKRTYILMVLITAFVLQVTSCTSTSVLAPIAEFVDREDVKDWDNKTLEEKRGVLLRAKVESPDMFIEYIDAEIEKIDEKIRIRDLPTPTPEPPPVDDDDDGEDKPYTRLIKMHGGGFLWKPVSESNGNLVVLTPPGVDYESARIIKNGTNETLEVAGKAGIANGNRRHWKFSKPGIAYGDGLIFRAFKTPSTADNWEIPEGGARVE